MDDEYTAYWLFALKDQILSLRNRYDHLMRQSELMSILYHSPSSIEDVNRWTDEVTNIRQQIAELMAKLPCEALLQILGPSRYKEYKEKHPINRDTKLEDFKIPLLYPTYRMAHLKPEYEIVTEPFPRFEYDYEDLIFEPWINPQWREHVFRLAYSPKLNTVFVYKG